MAGGFSIQVKLDTSDYLKDLGKVEQRFTKLAPLLKSLGATGVKEYRSVLYPDPNFMYFGFEEHNSQYSGEGRGYLSGAMQGSIVLTEETDNSVSVSPTVPYAESVADGIPVPPVKQLKPSTKGFPEFAFQKLVPIWEEEVLDYFSQVF